MYVIHVGVLDGNVSHIHGSHRQVLGRLRRGAAAERQLRQEVVHGHTNELEEELAERSVIGKPLA